MQFFEIHYLQWARSHAHGGGLTLPLAWSGVSTPPADFAEGLSVAELLDCDPGYYPPLAKEMAHSWGLSPASVLVQPGSHWNLLLAVAARLSKQAGPVVVEEPTYEPLWRIPLALGAELLRLPRPASAGYVLDRDALTALVARKPSLLLLSHPHNPTGLPLADDDVEFLARWSRESGCAVLSDEVYLEFLESPESSTLRTRVEGAASVRSFTKVLGLGPLRCSALSGPEHWIARAAAITDYGPVMVSAPTQHLASRAWAHRAALWARAREISAQGRPLVEAWARELADKVELSMPSAGIICFPRLRPEIAAEAASVARVEGVEGPFGFGLDAHPGGSHEWIELLRRRHGLLLTPGAFFDDPTGFRLGFGSPVLEEGLERLSSFLSSLPA